jgi:hypothetical protein
MYLYPDLKLNLAADVSTDGQGTFQQKIRVLGITSDEALNAIERSVWP